jgi:hypothetical protein
MTGLRFLLHRRALVAFNGLASAERDALETALAPLADLSVDQWSTRGAIRLATHQPLYVVRVDASLRALVRPAPGGEVELVDLVRHETLARWFNGVG